MPSIDPNTTLVRSESILASPLDKALVMMDIEGGDYFSLDDIGAKIWEHLAEPLSVQSLCAQLTAVYSVDPEVCQADVLAFLNQLLEAGLVVRADE